MDDRHGSGIPNEEMNRVFVTSTLTMSSNVMEVLAYHTTVPPVEVLSSRNTRKQNKTVKEKRG